VTDFVTVLQCAEGKRLAKQYSSLGSPPDDYDAGYLFVPTTLQIANLEDLACLLLELADMPDVCIVRGAVHPDAEGVPVRRLALDRPGECDAAFSPAAHHWIAVDVDHSDETFILDEATQCAQRWRWNTMKAGVWNMPMVWQWSAKAHLSPTVRGRAWLWNDEPIDDTLARRMCKAYGFDPALNNPVQPHYTARPLFPAGVADPIAEPVLLLDGPNEWDRIK
jgi:putative DNA primase/helicase